MKEKTMSKAKKIVAPAKVEKINDKIKVVIEIITPTIAEKYLEKNITNRQLSQKLVNRYVKTILAGEWLLDGQTIKFSENGTLLDGQHRLSAIMLSDTPLQTIVVRGLDPAAFQTIDTGKRRTMGDALYVCGYKNVNILSSAIRVAHVIESNKLKNIYPALFNGIKISNIQVIELAKQKQDIVESVRATGSEYDYTKKLLGPGGAAGLHYIFNKKDKKLCEILYAGLATGANLPRDSVILDVRNKLIRNLTEVRKLGFSDRIILVIRAWNLLRKNIHDVKLNIQPNVTVPEIL